jgi:hypothetical protein
MSRRVKGSTRLAALNFRRPHISGFGDRRCFTVLAEQFPEELHQRAIEAANNDDDWNGFFDKPERFSPNVANGGSPVTRGV